MAVAQRERYTRDPYLQVLDHVLESTRDCPVVLDVGRRQLSQAKDAQRGEEEMARHR